MKVLIEIYSTSIGKEPYSDWEDSLDNMVRAIIKNRLNRVRLGNFGDTTPVKGAIGIWEFRFDFGPGYRIYYGKKQNTYIILLNGGNKKSQNRDINKAKEYWLDCKD